MMRTRIILLVFAFSGKGKADDVLRPSVEEETAAKFQESFRDHKPEWCDRQLKNWADMSKMEVETYFKSHPELLLATIEGSALSNEAAPKLLEDPEFSASLKQLLATSSTSWSHRFKKLYALLNSKGLRWHDLVQHSAYIDAFLKDLEARETEFLDRFLREPLPTELPATEAEVQALPAKSLSQSLQLLYAIARSLGNKAPKAPESSVLVRYFLMPLSEKSPQ